MELIFIYLFIINAAGFLVMTADKLFAKSGAWRVPERTLMAVAAIGGSIGVLIAMYTVRHKTKHAKFVIGVPVILALQAALAVFLILH